MKEIYVVVPTIRPDSYEDFVARWKEQFTQHNVTLVTVWDGEVPVVEVNGRKYLYDEIEGHELVENFCAGVRSLGFLWVAQHYKDQEAVIVTLDDDMSPYGDTIGDHLRALTMRLPSSWFSTMIGDYPRGFPYGVRKETPVMLSHGIWRKNPDWDAPTQLLNDNADHTEYYRGLVPRGLFFPFCGMNVAFRLEVLPYVYYAPVGDFKGAERFDDIYAGVAMKPDFDALGWGIATGYAECVHERASNVFNNLEKEAVGIKYNETFWEGKADHPWFSEFIKKRNKWKDVCQNLVASLPERVDS